MKPIYYDDKERTANALEKIAEIKNNFAIHKETDKRIANAVEKLAEDGIAKKSDVVKAIITKGSVQSYGDLPMNPSIGDMYNIQSEDPEHEIHAGDNVVYTEEGWDNFGAYIDFSDLGLKWVKDVDGSGQTSLQATIQNDVTNNVASGAYSHAEGHGTTASEEASHAEGQETTASGSYSHAEGMQTIANHKSQHVFGEYNIADASSALASARGNYVEIVGNGTSANAKSNARTLDWSGNEALAGSLTLGKGTADEVTITATQLKALLSLTGFVPGSY